MSTKINGSALGRAEVSVDLAMHHLTMEATGKAHAAALRAIDALTEFVRSIDQRDKEEADAAAWAAIEELQSMAAEDERLGECTACGGPIFASETWSTDEGLMHQSCLYGLQEERERREDA